MIAFTRYLAVLLIVAVNLLTCTNVFSAKIDRVQLIRELPEGMADMILFNNKAFFLFRFDHPGLWVSDGTETGTKKIKSLPWAPELSNFITKRIDDDPYNRSIPIVLNGYFYFFAGSSLWKSNGTGAGTEIVKTQVPYSEWYAVLDNTLYLLSWDSLWRTDGTKAGTWKVASLVYASELVAFKSRLYFRASDPVHDEELWVSDGTAAGTGLLKDIKTFDTTYSCGWPFHPAECTDSNSRPSSFNVHNNTLYFTADNGVHGRELWKSDGTPAGTVMVRDIQPGPGGSGPNAFVAVGDHLLFSGFDEEHGRELWRTDGTHNGTIFLKDLMPGAKSSDALRFITAKMNDELYLNTWIGPSDSVGSLWKTDGTSNGTKVVQYGFINSYITPSSSVLDGRLYFLGYGGNRKGDELWVTDGTSAGTYQVKDILPGVDKYGQPYSSIPRFFVKNGDFILFEAYYEVYTTPEGYTQKKPGLFKLERSTVTVVPFLQVLLPGQQEIE